MFGREDRFVGEHWNIDALLHFSHQMDPVAMSGLLDERKLERQKRFDVFHGRVCVVESAIVIDGKYRCVAQGLADSTESSDIVNTGHTGLELERTNSRRPELLREGNALLNRVRPDADAARNNAHGLQVR